MFHHQGDSRTHRQNRLLAGYLAAVGGFVNSAGFLLVGSFTSHVTGNVGRLALDVATHQLDAALFALTMVAAFFGGAFAASMMIESDFVRAPYAYGSVLATEAGLLVAFTLLAGLTRTEHPRIQDAEAAILCGAMGMQNSLVTRLSGAVVRTTHLTGVITDLGIESARWFRWWRGSVSRRVQIKLAFGRSQPERPAPEKAALLGTIAGAFTLGAGAGAIATTHLGHAALTLPILAVGAFAAYAFVTGRELDRPDSRA
ncbi:MAG: YoaK family protein [Minicystis sp.]